jgi:hypothetical protein
MLFLEMAQCGRTDIDMVKVYNLRRLINIGNVHVNKIQRITDAVNCCFSTSNDLVTVHRWPRFQALCFRRK